MQEGKEVAGGGGGGGGGGKGMGDHPGLPRQQAVGGW